MALSRTAALLFLLPAPAAVYLAASMEDVNASAQCLPSPDAVHQQYPGSYASWTTHATNHKGEKCWFPATHENHSRHIETVPHHAAQTMMRKDATEHENVEPAAAGKARDETPVAFVGETKDLGWNFRARTTSVGSGNAAEEPTTPEETTFEDRFSAAREVSSAQKPSVIQRMMDPVGAIPHIP